MRSTRTDRHVVGTIYKDQVAEAASGETPESRQFRRSSSRWLMSGCPSLEGCGRRRTLRLTRCCCLRSTSSTPPADQSFRPYGVRCWLPEPMVWAHRASVLLFKNDETLDVSQRAQRPGVADGLLCAHAGYPLGTWGTASPTPRTRGVVSQHLGNPPRHRNQRAPLALGAPSWSVPEPAGGAF